MSSRPRLPPMTTLMSPANPLARPRWAALQLWGRMSLRERTALQVAAWVLGLGLIWLLAIAPAWRTISQAPARLEALDAQLQDMRALAAQARELRAIPPGAAGDVQAGLKAATARLGAAGRLNMQGDRATLTLTQCSAEQLQAWLADARSTARAWPIEAQLTRSPSGQLAGTLVVQIPSSP